jgi:hypothetical protein
VVRMRGAIWRQRGAMQQRTSDFGVIPRPFEGEKDRARLIAAVDIDCDFPAAEKTVTRNKTRKGTVKCPMP